MLGERLRLLRGELDLTQKEFAEKFGMSDARYNQYETGKRTPDYEILQLFADYFDVSVDYLLGRTTTKRPYENRHGVPPAPPGLFDEIEDLSDESKKELEKYIHLLKMKDQMDKGKEEQSCALEREA